MKRRDLIRMQEKTGGYFYEKAAIIQHMPILNFVSKYRGIMRLMSSSHSSS